MASNPVNVKELRVKVTYEVGLGDLEIPEDLAQILNETIDLTVGNDSLIAWLSNNISEGDAYQWEAEIMDFEINDQDNG